MYEFSKNILGKVSFDKTLFRKELIKAIERISPDEKIPLKLWCLGTFGQQYTEEIIEIFNTVTV